MHLTTSEERLLNRRHHFHQVLSHVSETLGSQNLSQPEYRDLQDTRRLARAYSTRTTPTHVGGSLFLTLSTPETSCLMMKSLPIFAEYHSSILIGEWKSLLEKLSNPSQAVVIDGQSLDVAGIVAIARYPDF